VLDRAPDRDAVTVGRCHEGVRLDRELGDHREAVRAFDDHVGGRCGSIHVLPPGVTVLVEHVALGVRIVRPELAVLDKRRLAGERRGERVDRG
jgi:hypothetical protein